MSCPVTQKIPEPESGDRGEQDELGDDPALTAGTEVRKAMTHDQMMRQPRLQAGTGARSVDVEPARARS